MEFKQIEAFVAVVRNSSFSRAAQEMYLSQPTVSCHVSALEKELNLKLIDRTYKEAIPTAEGKVLYNYALTLLNTRDQAVLSLQNFALNMNGNVKICTSSMPGKCIVPQLLAEFGKEYEKVTFTLQQKDSRGVLESLTRHECEIGFVGEKGKENFIYQPIAKDRMVFITPKYEKYNRMVNIGVCLSDLVGERLIMREEGSGTRVKFEETLERKGVPFSAVKVVAYISDTEAIIKAVSKGLGCAVVSESAIENTKAGTEYNVIDIIDYKDERTIFMVHDGKITLSPTAEAFRYFVQMKGEENVG